MPHMGWMGGKSTRPRKSRPTRDTERLMRRYRNHPSIIIWGTSGNMFGAWRDPKYVGTREASRAVEIAKGTPTSQAFPLAEIGIGIIKSNDPTRPVLIHNGGSAGDIYTLNNYLNFIPLQEREEWLSHYVQKGDMPLMYVEFGTPVNISIMRGRNGFQNAYRSENWLTEFASIYLGKDAYKLEPAEYRKRSAELFEKDQTHAWSQSMPERDFSPSWMRLQDMFLTNTWRSWRTMGMTGGMVPWDRGYTRLNGKLTTAGEALRASTSATLGWIAGALRRGVAAFTAKDHSYFAGEKVASRSRCQRFARPSEYSVRWGAPSAITPPGAPERDIASADAFVPSSSPRPPPSKGSGHPLDATIGGNKHSDRFRLRVFARGALQGAVSVFDPEGKSAAMLRALGYTVSPWNGKPGPQLLVIGRNALKSGRLPGSLKTFVQSGGRVLLSGHDPHWLRENMGVRVSFHQSRRVWNVGENGVAAGLDEMDLRDWRGHSTLLDPRPDYVNGKGPDVRAGKTTYPYAGWRWGNRGTVASAAIEKPHLSGWRPLMECEFDLSYSPLMELDSGKGKVIWSQLDLEDHAALDPAAQRVAQQLLRYAVTAPLSPRAATVYIGGEAGGALLRSLGVQFQARRNCPLRALAILGPDATIGGAQLDAFARTGGKVLFLPRRDAATGAAGLQLQQKTDFVGSLQAPAWPEARGLSRPT
jgi:beta-galactosidase